MDERSGHGRRRARLRRRLAWAAALMLGVAILPQTASAWTIDVGQGDAVVLHLRLPAHHVVVGNPKVADVVMENAKTMSIFGRQAGGTTLIAMDRRGRTLIDAQIMVKNAARDGVAVMFGTGRQISAGGTVLAYTCDASSCVRKNEKGGVGR